jgi:hypothetical protein
MKESIIKQRMEEKQAEILNPNLDGYKMCYLCGRYYELGTEHPCFEFHRKGGRRRQGWSEERAIKERKGELNGLDKDKR